MRAAYLRVVKKKLFITFASQKPPSASALLGGERRSCSLAGEAILLVCESAKGREMRRLSFLKLVDIQCNFYNYT